MNMRIAHHDPAAAAALDTQQTRTESHAAKHHAVVFYKGKRIRKRPSAHKTKRARHPLTKHLKQKAAANHAHSSAGAHLSRFGAGIPRTPHQVGARNGHQGGRDRDDTPEQETEEAVPYSAKIRATATLREPAPLPGVLQEVARAYADSPHLTKRLLALYDEDADALARELAEPGMNSLMLRVFSSGHDLLTARIVGNLSDELDGDALPVARMPLVAGVPAAAARKDVAAASNPPKTNPDSWTPQHTFNVLRQLVRFNLMGPRTLSQLRSATQRLRMQHALASGRARDSASHSQHADSHFDNVSQQSRLK